MNWPDLACLLFTLLGMAYTFSPGCCCGCQCSLCPTRPHRVQLVITGVVANTCADCPDVNGTWLLDDCCASVYINPSTPEDGLLDPLPGSSCCGFDQNEAACSWQIDGPDLCGDLVRIEFHRNCHIVDDSYTLSAVVRAIDDCATIAAWSKTGAPGSCGDACEWSSVALTTASTVGPCSSGAATCAVTSL